MTNKKILNREQIRSFQKDGFLAIDSLTTQEDVAFLREIYDALFAERRGRNRGDQFDLAGADEEGQEAALPQILGPARYAPELNDSLLRRNCSLALSDLFGQVVEADFSHAIFKPAQHGAETPWHQDAAYWNPAVIDTAVSVWVPLQEATPENGCMHFVPGSNVLEILPHRPINNDPRVHGLELLPELLADHGGFTLHHAPANHSEIPRRALILGASIGAATRTVPINVPWQQQRQTAREMRAAQNQNN